jgi:hypothetical protein
LGKNLTAHGNAAFLVPVASGIPFTFIGLHPPNTPGTSFFRLH